MRAPRDTHPHAVFCILWYLKTHPGRGLFYARQSSLPVYGYSDANWAGFLDDHRSASGYCVFLGSHLFSQRNKKQIVLAHSSAKAEYHVVANIVVELLWLRQFLFELGLAPADSLTMFCDNQAAINIDSNFVFHERTMHIEVDCHFL